MGYRVGQICYGFNTQPPEGGWYGLTQQNVADITVSTHSRLKAAGKYIGKLHLSLPVSTHSRLKAAGLFTRDTEVLGPVSTHSRLKAAGQQSNQKRHQRAVSTHSRLKAAGPVAALLTAALVCFNTQPPEGGWLNHGVDFRFSEAVSTHSRLKAAGHAFRANQYELQPFQHTAA